MSGPRTVPTEPQPLSQRFVIILGKGGVGRSIVASALALRESQLGRRVLIALSYAKERCSHYLETHAIDTNITSIAPNIDAVNISPEHAIAEYANMTITSAWLYRMLLGNPKVLRFLRATPGMDAWATLGKASYHALETLPDGRPRYDLVIFDAPATGQAIDMLRVPRVIAGLTRGSRLVRDAEQALAMIYDRSQTLICGVTLAEELPVQETLSLQKTLSDEFNLGLDALIVNRTLTPLIDAQTLADLDSTLNAGEHVQKKLRTLCQRRHERENQQAKYIAMLADRSHRLIQLPWLTASRFGLLETQALAERLSLTPSS